MFFIIYLKKIYDLLTFIYSALHIGGFVSSHVICYNKFIIEMEKPSSLINLLYSADI
jgi:hypothetical protein